MDDVQRSLGRVEGKLDLIIANQAKFEERLFALEEASATAKASTGTSKNWMTYLLSIGALLLSGLTFMKGMK